MQESKNAQYLLETLRQCYDLTVDCGGTLFYGISLQWNYDEQTVDLSTTTYIKKAFTKFQHPPPRVAQHPPQKCIPIKYTLH